MKIKLAEIRNKLKWLFIEYIALKGLIRLNNNHGFP